jgi:hypothetical protein
MQTLTNHRTTLTLEADAFEFAKTYANAKAMRLGEAITDLIRQARGQTEAKAVRVGQAWVFDLPPAKNAALISMAQVQSLLDEQ